MAWDIPKTYVKTFAVPKGIGVNSGTALNGSVYDVLNIADSSIITPSKARYEISEKENQRHTIIRVHADTLYAFKKSCKRLRNLGKQGVPITDTKTEYQQLYAARNDFPMQFVGWEIDGIDSPELKIGNASIDYDPRVHLSIVDEGRSDKHTFLNISSFHKGSLEHLCNGINCLPSFGIQIAKAGRIKEVLK